jgi:K+-transporting ATPase KdpF subunit
LPKSAKHSRRAGWAQPGQPPSTAHARAGTTGICLERETSDARRDDVAFHRHLLRGSLSLRQGLPEIEVAMDLITAVALVLSILLLGYLTVSLLYPEKF